MGNKTMYRVKITSPNHFIIHKSKQVRTPAEFINVYEHELTSLKSQIYRLSLDYTVTKENDSIEDIIEDVPITESRKEVQIEELYNKEVDKPVTIMDKLIAEENEAETK